MHVCIQIASTNEILFDSLDHKHPFKNHVADGFILHTECVNMSVYLLKQIPF